MVRMEPATRDELMKVAADDFGGISANDTVKRLLDEHRKAMMIAAVRAYELEHPQEYDAYLREADEMDAASELVEREMCRAFDLDPPLAVDVGVGKDWLAAK